MRTACTRLAALLLVAVLVASCGGGSKDTTGSKAGSSDDSVPTSAAKADDTGADDTAAEDTGSADTGSADTGSADTGADDTGSDATAGGRPDGKWLVVETDTAATPANLTTVDTSYLRLVEFTPSCKSGPCKVSMKRVTDAGGAVPKDYPEDDSGNTSLDEIKPGSSSYRDGTYSISYSGPTTCTKEDGTFGTKTGEATFTTTYEFTYDSGGAAPVIDGTSTTSYETTSEGVAAGCKANDDGKITSRLQGVPLDSVADAGGEITGDWVSTGRVQSADDLTVKEHGGRGTLLSPVKWTIKDGCTGTGCDDTLVFPEIAGGVSMDLAKDGDHWKGTRESVGDCSKNGSGEVILKGGYHDTEEYDFTTAASVDGKATILVGLFKRTATPTPEAVAASATDCVPQHLETYLVVVRP
jgi:hypothetical protein